MAALRQSVFQIPFALPLRNQLHIHLPMCRVSSVAWSSFRCAVRSFSSGSSPPFSSSTASAVSAVSPVISMPASYDVIIIGGGIAGASAAYSLSQYATHKRIAVLERESSLCFHSTGRSAAVYMETYGNLPIRILTTGSKPSLFHPQQTGLLDVSAEIQIATKRGAMFTGSKEEAESTKKFYDERVALIPNLKFLSSHEEIAKICPVLKSEVSHSAVYEPDAADLDVDVIYQAFMRAAIARGTQIYKNFEVMEMSNTDGKWTVAVEDRSLGQGSLRTMEAPIVINAAGAWGDVIAERAGVQPVGLQPKRRTIVLADLPSSSGISPAAFNVWPFVCAMDESWYFKPVNSEVLMLSPADQTPVQPYDAAPEEEDVALCMQRVQDATTLTLPAIRRKWAGLRSFVFDHSPVVGFDDKAPGFFWLVGQGGYGIQTAPAISELVGQLVVNKKLPQKLEELGLTNEMIGIDRIRNHQSASSRPGWKEEAATWGIFGLISSLF